MKLNFFTTIIFCLTINFIIGQTTSFDKDSSVFKVRGNPDYYVDGIKVCCFNGEWNGKNIKIILNKDSTFNLSYSLHPTYYQTCGHWTKKADEIILTDFQDHDSMLYEVDCNSYKRGQKDTIVAGNDSTFQKFAIKKNIWTVFDNDNHVKLKIDGNKLYWTSKKITLTSQHK